MLKKENRLTKRSSFIATYHQGHVISDDFFVLYVGKNKIANTNTKFGFVVSKKVHKRAVIRNKIKRRMREAVRYLSRDMKFNCMSLILKAKPGSVALDYSASLKSIYNLLLKIANKIV